MKAPRQLATGLDWMLPLCGMAFDSLAHSLWLYHVNASAGRFAVKPILDVVLIVLVRRERRSLLLLGLVVLLNAPAGGDLILKISIGALSLCALILYGAHWRFARPRVITSSGQPVGAKRRLRAAGFPFDKPLRRDALMVSVLTVWSGLILSAVIAGLTTRMRSNAAGLASTWRFVIITAVIAIAPVYLLGWFREILRQRISPSTSQT